MNTTRTLNTEYLRPSRTIETVLVSNFSLEKIFFIYNYEGNSFRLFESHLSLLNFLNENETESDFIFETEEHLDSFLLNIELNN